MMMSASSDSNCINMEHAPLLSPLSLPPPSLVVFLKLKHVGTPGGGAREAEGEGGKDWSALSLYNAKSAGSPAGSELNGAATFGATTHAPNDTLLDRNVFG
jgi:hypothetical protein